MRLHLLRWKSSGWNRAKRWISRALAIFGFVALCWWAYGIVVPEAVEISPETLSADPGSDSVDPLVALAANLNVPLLEGNRVELLVNGDEIFPAMLAAIRGARKSVNLLTYIYWEGDIAKEFAAALTAAARRGVEVRVLVDAFGGRRMHPDLIDTMRAAGCRFEWFHPVRWYNLRRFNNRSHRKVMVVDGQIGFTGGVGIGDEWTGDAQDPEHWRDDHFRIEGPVVRYLQGAFAENWRQASGEALTGERMFPPIVVAGDARMVPLNAAPAGDISDIAFTYWLLFHLAQTEVRIATPYFIPDPDMKFGIADAARRGVRISLLVPGPVQDSALARYSSHTYYRRLLEAGVRIFEYQPTMMHVKTVSIDGAWAIIGSANFDSRSFELNYEIALAVQDPAVMGALNESWAADIARSKEVTLAEVDDWSWYARLRDRAALLLREQL